MICRRTGRAGGRNGRDARCHRAPPRWRLSQSERRQDGGFPSQSAAKIAALHTAAARVDARPSVRGARTMIHFAYISVTIF